jgi:hypothetical protein
MFLTHYYHQQDKPFQSLSALREAEALNIISRLSDRDELVYRRFHQPEQYLKLRQETEAWVRESFIRKGGKPSSSYPQYFVINQSTWIEEGFNQQSHSVSIPLSAFNLDRVSFTFPDSMVSYWLRTQSDAVYYRPEYHGHVFLIEEIHNIIDRFGIPDKEWKTEKHRKYDLFIEAQVWDSCENIGARK